jgi:TolA-binding protein
VRAFLAGPAARALAARGFAAALLLAAALAAPAAARGAKATAPNRPPAGASERAEAAVDSAGPYRSLIRALSARSVQDSIGFGAYSAAIRAFEAGQFDDAAGMLKEFSQQYPRSLWVNDALETMFLIRENRDFEDRPLTLQVAAMKLRGEGRADSAAALVRQGLARYPGANLRHVWNYSLAEWARDRGDHEAAVLYAVVVADTAAHSRLAPYALRLAGDETLASGKNPARALRFYQDLLERFPESPISPPVRARLLELRKKLQL